MPVQTVREEKILLIEKAASFQIKQMFDLQFQVLAGLFLLKSKAKKAYKKPSLTTEYKIEVTKTGGYYRGG